MDSRDILVAGLDILLAILIVFVLAFFAIRYDETRGPDPEFTSVNLLEAMESGDYETMHYVGLYLSDNEVWLHEFRLGSWLERGPTLTADWLVVVDSELRRMELPVVIYELEPSEKLGDVVRLVTGIGQPVGIASIPSDASENDD